MKIKVYGSGCPKCKELFDNAQAALDVAGMDAEIEKVTDMGAIVAAGVMMTPALEIDGQVVSSGKVLSVKEVMAMLAKAGENGKGGACCCCRRESVSQEEKKPGEEGKTDAKPAGACCCSGSSPAKKLLAYLLLTFVGIAVITLFLREKRTPDSPPTVQEVSQPSTLVVYYFHGSMRCMICNKFEALVKETLAERFGDETAKGRLTLQIVNVDKPENEHFIKDYGLTTKSVVLAQGGDFRNLDQIWTLVRQGDEAFKEYVAKNIREMLGEAK